MHVRHSLPPLMSIGLFQEKFKEGVGWWWYIYIYIHFLKNPWNLHIGHFTLRKQAFTPGNSTSLCYTPWKFQDQKSKTNEHPHNFFSITPKKSFSFLIDSGISACFFQYPLKFNVLNSPYLTFFFWNRVVIENVFG